jgi:hypothetical protein
MPMIFYPYEDKLDVTSLKERLEILLEAAEQYKAVVLDAATKTVDSGKKRTVPNDLSHAFNWEEIAKLLREIRELPEATSPNKIAKSESLTKLAEVYEALRAAKMPKLEAVRLALVNEANQLNPGGSSSQVA